MRAAPLAALGLTWTDDPPTLACSKCNKPFRRRELLVRHEKRGNCADDDGSDAAVSVPPLAGPSQPPVDPAQALIGALSPSTEAGDSPLRVPLLDSSLFASAFSSVVVTPASIGGGRETLTERGRRNLLDWLGDPAFVSDVAFSVEALRLACASYWARWHPVVPMLHQATYCPDEASPAHLLAVVLIGRALESSLGPTHGHLFARIRSRLLEPVLAVGASLVDFQTLLLAECVETG